jgi:hypothetical protein
VSAGPSREQQFPFLSAIHPAHLEYIRSQPVNTLDYFFGLLDALDSEKRFEVLGWTYLLAQRNMSFDAQTGYPRTPKNTAEEYDAFKQRCRSAAQVVSEPLVIIGLVHATLGELFRLGDPTAVEATKSRLVRMAEMKDSDLEAAGLPRPSDADVAWLVNHITDLPEKAERYYALYVYFCEQVVEQLRFQPV